MSYFGYFYFFLFGTFVFFFYHFGRDECVSPVKIIHFAIFLFVHVSSGRESSRFCRLRSLFIPPHWHEPSRAGPIIVSFCVLSFQKKKKKKKKKKSYSLSQRGPSWFSFVQVDKHAFFFSFYFYTVTRGSCIQDTLFSPSLPICPDFQTIITPLFFEPRSFEFRRKKNITSLMFTVGLAIVDNNNKKKDKHNS